ncbi:MAG TPA: hypothetical protein VFV38_30805 [Ktedonobacteraceae bacterium]|nr:hypothetical protein [Ktedonobacteraceae bacterium]
MRKINLHFSINFEITIADMPPEIEPDQLSGIGPEEYHDYQARLLEAVKSHPGVLAQYLRSLVADKLMEHNRWDWDDLLMGVQPGEEVDVEKILAPAIRTLSHEDREFWQDRGELDFSDMADLFLASFTVEEQPPMIWDVSAIQKQVTCAIKRSGSYADKIAAILESDVKEEK